MGEETKEEEDFLLCLTEQPCETVLTLLQSLMSDVEKGAVEIMEAHMECGIKTEPGSGCFDRKTRSNEETWTFKIFRKGASDE